MSDWLIVRRGSTALVLSVPHAGTEIPRGITPPLASAWLARKDTDWCVDRLYDSAGALELTRAVEAACDATLFTRVTNGRFRGGFITRHYGHPGLGAHAIQMELACRAYLEEPVGPVDETNWPPPFDDHRAAPMAAALREVLKACTQFAVSKARGAV